MKKLHFNKTYTMAGITLVLVLAVFLGLAPSRNNKFTGEIDQNFIDRLAQLKDRETIYILSPGGDPDYGEQFATLLEEKQINVVINGLCLSSCAEYILPAAASITFAKQSLVGFHQNPIMINYFKETRSKTLKPTCLYEDNIIGTAQLQLRKLGKNDFWRQVLLRLEADRVIIDAQYEACALVKFKLKRHFWFPTSKQLQTLYGLKFSGTLCSDSISCIRQKLLKLNLPGEYVVGDDIFIVSNNRVFSSNETIEFP